MYENGNKKNGNNGSKHARIITFRASKWYQSLITKAVKESYYLTPSEVIRHAMYFFAETVGDYVLASGEIPFLLGDHDDTTDLVSKHICVKAPIKLFDLYADYARSMDTSVSFVVRKALQLWFERDKAGFIESLKLLLIEEILDKALTYSDCIEISQLLGGISSSNDDEE